MKTRPSRTFFDRACDAARISEDRRHYLRTISNAMGLNEDEPAHVYLVVGDVVTTALATSKEYMTTVPAQVREAVNKAAKAVKPEFDASIERAAEVTGDRIGSAVTTALDELARREQRKNWPWLALAFGTLMLVSVSLGWSLSESNDLHAALFWTEIIDNGAAVDWQRIIERNPQLPADLAACGSDVTRATYQKSRIACRTALWLTPASGVELNFVDKLTSAPALLFGRFPFVVVGALGCLFGLVVSGLLYWRWGKS